MKNYQTPDEKDFFGEHGGLYVSETLIPALQELADAYKAASKKYFGVSASELTLD